MTTSLRGLLTVAFGLCWATPPAGAFNPPVDTAGPLTVRIVAPAEVAQRQSPVEIRVELANKSDAPLEGTLQVRSADDWTFEPAAPVLFSVPAGGSTTKSYQLQSGPDTCRGHYPLHAVARFRHADAEYVAHPILVFEAKFDPLPWPQYLQWKPFELPRHGELGLWWLTLRRAVVHSAGRPAEELPLGWQGTHAASKATLSVRAVTLEGQAREAIVMHPPWASGRVGSILCEFPLQLPPAGPLKFTCLAAVRPEGNGDGVTFRVRAAAIDDPADALGQVVWQQHVTARQWLPITVDLASLAGRTIRLQLESHPGPANNTNFDESYWAEPTLIAGESPTAAAFPPADATGSRLLGTIDAADRKCEVRLWPGRRGLLDAVVGFGSGSQWLSFRGFEARACGAALDDPRSPVVLLEAKEEPADGVFQVRHRFRSLQGDFDLVGRLTVEQGALRAAFRLENAPPPRPWQALHLEDLAAGPWSRTVEQLYAGHGNVVREPGAFELGFDGHRLATSFVGFEFDRGWSLVQGTDLPPQSLRVRPAERHYSLHVPHQATLSFIPAGSVWSAVHTWRAVNGLKPAGGVGKLAGRFVFDLWGGRYAESTAALRDAFCYGLTDAAVVWHNWQRWGYDYRLPDIWPPNPQFGTPDEMRQLAQTCRQAGVLFAPHDNYIDFYPDAEGFSYPQQVAFRAPGEPVRAWLNEGRGAQSYRYRADTIEPWLRRNVKWVRDGLHPSGYFIDVWSSIDPYDYWTADGRFVDRVTTRDTWGRHFAWIRQTLGDDAPQISESGHDQLIGWLDGGQTNHLRVGKPLPGPHTWCVWNIPCADAERIAWSDAAHHDRFVLHGAGYPGRYEGGLDPRLHGIYSDDYLATEVLTGHPAMVAQAFGRDVVRKYWLLHGLGRALALRTIDEVLFDQGPGRVVPPSETHAAAQTDVRLDGGDLHRQDVHWSGGGRVCVNRGESDWMVPGGEVLPPYGFLARVPTADGLVEAQLVRRDGQIVEIARAPTEMYVNGREIVDGPVQVRLQVEEARLSGRQVELTLRWQLDGPVPDGWRPFLHFVRPDGEIVFQAGVEPQTFPAGHRGPLPGRARCTLPEDVKPGQSFELRLGFYRPGDGQRLALPGPDDGQRRVSLGTLALEGSQGVVQSVAWTRRPAEPDPLLARQNPQGKAVDFGPIATAGGCRLSLAEGRLLVVPLPQPAGAKFTARIAWERLPWKLPRPTEVEPLGRQGEALPRQPAVWQGDVLQVEIPADQFAWRL